jgi:single-stranded-DNA-specific exonuclease
MSYLPKIWRWAPISLKLQQQLCSVLAIPPVVANLLINRGITNPDEARHFLFGGFQDLHEPFFLKDMEKAVNRIQQAIDGQEKIMIYGDYDVDGITASAIMFLVLTRLGAQVEYYIPERESEGYGLHHGALMDMYASGTSLVITVDCGISATKEIEQSMMDIIITDHHQPPEQLPPAYAIINPKRKDCLYPDKKLAGVGVAFKLCQALGQAYQLSEDE